MIHDRSRIHRTNKNMSIRRSKPVAFTVMPVFAQQPYSQSGRRNSTAISGQRLTGGYLINRVKYENLRSVLERKVKGAGLRSAKDS